VENRLLKLYKIAGDTKLENNGMRLLTRQDEIYRLVGQW